mgnify:CR=1 FL=1
MTMDYQRILAIDLLEAETEVPKDEIEKYEDWELEAWLYELGFDWNGRKWVTEDEVTQTTAT